MKVDSDTFFLWELCYGSCVTTTQGKRSYVHVEGALEGASRGVLRKYGPGALLKCTPNVNKDRIFDDRCLEKCVRRSLE